MNNLLIGAISGNYKITDIHKWVQSSNEIDSKRILLLYNNQFNLEIIPYLNNHGIVVIVPEHNMYGETVEEFSLELTEGEEGEEAQGEDGIKSFDDFGGEEEEDFGGEEAQDDEIQDEIQDELEEEEEESENKLESFQSFINKKK